MAIAAKGEFPAALTAIQYWMKPIKNPHMILDSLQESGLCQRFPADALKLLGAVIDDKSSGQQNDLNLCLGKIAEAKPNLAEDTRYVRLREYSGISGRWWS